MVPVILGVLALLACNVSALPTALPVQALPTPSPVVTAASPSPSAAPATATPAARAFDPVRFKQDLDPAVAAFLAPNNVPGCAVALVYPDPASAKLLTQTFSYGLTSKATQRPVTAATLFEIGSLSKLFAADLLALNVTHNQMALDDPLQKYLPATVHVPTYNQKVITLGELATHTSGLPRTDGQPSVRKVKGVAFFGYATDDELFGFLNAYQLTAPPGQKWLYSNLANALLGIAEERVGQGSFDSLVVNQISGPLGLSDTRGAPTAAEQPDMAQGYLPDGQPAPAFDEDSAEVAAGGLHATAKDLAAYLVANMDPANTPLAQVLQMTQQRQTFGPKPGVSMGLGWLIANPGAPAEQFSKDGATAGFNAYITFSRVNHTGFAVVCNGHNVTQMLAPQIAKFLGAAEIEVADTP